MNTLLKLSLLSLLLAFSLACECKQTRPSTRPTQVSTPTPAPAPPAPTPSPTPPPCSQPVILRFAPDAPSVTLASPCTMLRWDVSGAVSVTLEGSSTGDTWEVLDPKAPLVGSRQVCPTKTRRFRLTVVNACGQVTQIVTVQR